MIKKYNTYFPGNDATSGNKRKTIFRKKSEWQWRCGGIKGYTNYSIRMEELYFVKSIYE
jgi:hypothetical protein